MNLKRETVKQAYLELGERHGWPPGAKTDEQKRRIVDVDHRELSKWLTEETFPEALSIAWQQARRFPVVADFHRGFDAPKADGISRKEEEKLRSIYEDSSS